VTTRPDLLVVGGGIAGLTTALAAAERGLRVTVVDVPRVGAASRASAGLLAPTVDGLPASALGPAVAARELYPDFLAGLYERSDIRVPLDRRGILELASTQEELAALHARGHPRAERLDCIALARIEPALARHAGALLHPDDGAVDNVILMTALDVAVAREPAITRVPADVVSVDLAGAVPALGTRAGDRYEGGALLLAAGAWSGGLPGLPRPLPVRPVRGQLVRLAALPVHHVTFGAGGYLLPRGDTLLVGATNEEAGFECVATEAGLAELSAIAARAVPELAGAPVVEHWAGLRPISRDGLPILGADPEHPTLQYACGYSRNGILLAPWAAAQLAESLAGTGPTPELARFSIARFVEDQ
jgi:glycine oxidase